MKLSSQVVQGHMDFINNARQQYGDQIKKKKKNIIRDKSFLQHFIMESKCLIQALPGDMSIFQSCVCGPTWINPFLDHFPQDQLSLLHPTLPAEPIHNYIRCNDIKQQTFFHLIHPKKSFVHMIFSYKTINKGAK
jgi:hypothetical protein